MHTLDVGDQFPAVKGLLEDFQFIECSLIIFGLMLTAKCFL